MRTTIEISGIIDDDVSIGTITYLLDTAGIASVRIKSQTQFDDWRESLPKEPITDLATACLDWIHSWGNGGGDYSSENLIGEAIRELKSDAAAKLADAAFCSVCDYSKSRFDAASLVMTMVQECIEELSVEMVQKSSGEAIRIADSYVEQFGSHAATQFLDKISGYAEPLAEEIVFLLNQRKADGDHEIVKCHFCYKHSLWGGYEDTPTFWECEECGNIFCDSCRPIDNEEDKRVLCGSCRDKQ